MEISTIDDFNRITCAKRIKVLTGRPGIDYESYEYKGDKKFNEIQKITCHYFGRHDIDAGGQYAIEGWFGYSQRHDSWHSALRDIAHKHGFSYEVIREGWVLECQPESEPYSDDNPPPYNPPVANITTY